MGKIALITGITGQDGSYLAKFLLEKDYKIYGIVRRNSELFNYNRLSDIRDNLNLIYGDLTDSLSISNIINTIIKENNFDILEIYNLAAQSHVHISFQIPEYTAQVDGIGTLKILENIKLLDKSDRDKVKFYQAGTSEMYGEVLETPQSEKTPFNPQSPYASAKLYSHFITKNYRESYNIFACNGILFNHESPRRGDNFVTKKIINYVKKVKCNNHLNDVLYLGNINSKRDWGHAKDYVIAMWLMLQQDSPSDYVIGMGETYTIREFIEKSFKKINIELEWQGVNLDEIGINKNTGEVLIRIDEKYFRPNEVDLLLSNPSKAKNLLGWKAEYDTLDKLIDSMLND
jgi:GDPmannose 4,6-dehydratase